MFHLSHQLMMFLLFSTGLLAATVDAIAGGGGLISLPVLMWVGIPPHIALGTNKLQATTGTFVATTSYYRRGWFSLTTIYKGLIFGFLGAVAGALTGQVVSSHILRYIIPALLLFV